MTNKEGTIVGSIFTIIILLYIMIGMKLDLDRQKLATIKTQKEALLLYKEKKEVEGRLEIAHENLGSLNSELDKYERAETTIQKVIKELP